MRKIGGRGKKGEETNLDDHVLSLVGIQSVLDVTFSDDSNVSNDFDGGRTEHVVLVLRK